MSLTAPQVHKDFTGILTMIKAGVHPYLVGPSGCGKSTIARHTADTLSLPFYYSSAVQSEFQLRGFIDAHGRLIRTPFRDAYENGGLFLFDELDSSEPRAIVSFHTALDNGVLDAPDGMIPKHEHFHYMGAANTWGHGATMDYIGRNALDGATLDRYAFVPLDYDEDLERQIVADKFPTRAEWARVVQAARAASREQKIRHIISPRASFNGAALLESGMDPALVFNRTVIKGLNKDDAIKITPPQLVLSEAWEKSAGEDDELLGFITYQINRARLNANESSMLSRRAESGVHDAQRELERIRANLKDLNDPAVQRVIRIIKGARNLFNFPSPH